MEEELKLAKAAAKAALMEQELPGLQPPRPERKLTPTEQEIKDVAKAFADGKRKEQRESIMRKIRWENQDSLNKEKNCPVAKGSPNNTNPPPECQEPHWDLRRRRRAEEDSGGGRPKENLQ